jgi:hypothetical protein
MTLRVASFGGGWQSTAMLVLAATGRIDVPVMLFANVGEDSENPATLDYVRDVAMPYAAAHGIEIHELHKVRRGGLTETLLQTLTRTERSIGIPVRMANGAPGNRSCTNDFKIMVVDQWLKEHGATAASPATVAIGISTDELHRAKTNDSRRPWALNSYPLLDLRLSRQDCGRLIEAAGLPVPPKSSCYFCPFHKMTEWQTMKREQPALFDRSVALETMLNERRRRLGKDSVFLTSKGQPLLEAVGDQSVFDFSEDTCESGYCMT